MKSRSTSIVAVLALALGLSVVAPAQFVTQNFWHMGEDGSVTPTDSVDSSSFDEKVGDPIVSSNHAPNSTASVRYTRTTDAAGNVTAATGSYLNDSARFVSIPATDWVFETWVNVIDYTPGGTSIVHLGTAGGGGWADIKLSEQDTIFFGRENQSYGVFSDAPIALNTWHHVAYAQFDGRLHGYLNGIELTSNFGGTETDPSVNNNGQLHFGVRPGNSEHLNGYLDEARFSTFAPGTFSTSQLLINNPVPEPATMAALGLGAMALLKRRRKA